MVILTLTESPAEAVETRIVEINSIHIANDGTAGNAGQLILRDNVVDDSEILSNGALTSGTDWTDSGDASLESDHLLYVDSAHSGGVSQAIADFAEAPEPLALYEFTYTISAAAGEATGTITTAIATSAATLDLSDGTHSVQFRVKLGATAFTLAFVSDADDTFVMDNLSLLKVSGAQRLLIPILGTQHSQASYGFDKPARLEDGLQVEILTADHAIVTIVYQ